METRFEIQNSPSHLLSLYYLFGPAEGVNLSIFERVEHEEHCGLVQHMRKAGTSQMPAP